MGKFSLVSFELQKEESYKGCCLKTFNRYAKLFFPGLLQKYSSMIFHCSWLLTLMKQVYIHCTCTLAEKGSKEIAIVGTEDKRQITAVLACTPLGELRPPQLLYQGTTDRCPPPSSVRFPEGWDIWHSHSHWSAELYFVIFIRSWFHGPVK